MTTKPQKYVSLDQFLTPKEIAKAVKLWRNRPDGSPYPIQQICEELIRPNMERINKALAQENDPMYLAWMVVYVVAVELNP